jgi:alpha-L-fucosidase
MNRTFFTVLILLLVAGGGGLRAQQAPFDYSWKSLEHYRCPDWFRDAKFGIFTHWNAQTVASGVNCDWYARDMYIEGSAPYKYHIQHFGHPSKVGYKDLIEMWKGENFDPDHLVSLFRDAGAKYIVNVGVFCDNFDLWDSRYHEWNSVNHGPHRNIIGEWETAVRKSGLHWGVTSHLERAINWFGTCHGADKEGEFAGVPYDGTDPKYADLYFKEYPGFNYTGHDYAIDPPQEVIVDHFSRIKDLLDRYHPDLFYIDGGIPFGETGRKLIAYYYNTNMARHEGRLEAVMCLKNYGDSGSGTYHGIDLRSGIAVEDVESGQLAGLNALPWQTDISVGSTWFWNKTFKYNSPKYVIDQLIDIVSKNGNLLLNIPPRSDGTLDDGAIALLKDIGKWLKVNGEGIYGTRPYSTFGEGPTEVAGGHFTRMAELTAQDFRFTTRNDTAYVFVCGTDLQSVAIKTFSAKKYHRIQSISLLGVEGELPFAQEYETLHVSLPAVKPSEYAVCLKIVPVLNPVPESLANY